MPQLAYQAVYPKLSSFYFFYFAVLGVVLPYLSLYFQSLSFSPVQIGQLLAVLIGTKVIAPNLLGWLSDKQAAPIKWVRLATFFALLAGAGLVIFEQFYALLITVFIFSFFWHAALPQYESYAFTLLGKANKHRYGQVRLWGSVGFIVAVVVLGSLIEHNSVAVLPWSILLLLLGVWLTTLWVKDRQTTQVSVEALPFMNIVRQPWVLSLLGVSFLMQFSHGTYYSFYSIFLNDTGYSKTLIAWLWALGVIAEIAIFYWMAPLLQKFAATKLILISLWLTLLRWVLIPLFPDSLSVLLFAQLLHAASFGLFHAAAIYLIDEHFSGANQGKGQAIFASSSHGLGGALGMLCAGYAWTFGGASWAFGLSAGLVVLAIMLTYAQLCRKQAL
ncbi:MFS transporter [Thiosulfativibrio zosterae]|uniref:MFS metabolite transporter n=1 Tax=Thiosulfativibrio zosterae TaxID=2675053 RepID=A0A6F8PPQ5_9GAMM|nr:MFS transporter [Thiosulfativibrio zosterae]BBP44018.1 MFS metabolite transporter [Thiosulfativibrio zosterae]